MTIAELFVKLGIKGDDETKKKTEGVSAGLKNVGSSGMAAKAAVLGMVYGLQQMTSAFGKTGMGLEQFTNAGYGSAQMLQKWQKMGLDFGVSGDEIEGTVKGIQNAMTNMQLGLGAPKGFNIFENAVGLDESKINDTFYLMSKLQEFAKKGDPAVVRTLMAGLGVSDNVFAMMRTNMRDVNSYTANYSEAQIRALANVDKAWAHFWDNLKRVGAGLTAEFGNGAINELDKSVKMIQRIGNALEKFGGQGAKIAAGLAVIGVALWSAFGPIGPIILALGVALSELEKYAEGKDNMFSKLGKWADEHGLTSKPGTNPDGTTNLSAYGGGDPMKGLYTPGMKGYVPPAGNQTTNINLAQTFTDGSKVDPHQVGRHALNGVQEAHRQNAARTYVK